MEGKIIMKWRKSSYSQNGGECVETASGNGLVMVRDTTNRDGGTLGFSASAWERFTRACKRISRSGRPRLAVRPGSSAF